MSSRSCLKLSFLWSAFHGVLEKVCTASNMTNNMEVLDIVDPTIWNTERGASEPRGSQHASCQVVEARDCPVGAEERESKTLSDGYIPDAGRSKNKNRSFVGRESERDCEFS